MKIFDTSSIVCLLKEIDEPGVLDICETLGYDIYVTAEVYEELQENEETFKKFQSYGKFGVLPKDNTGCVDKIRKRHIQLHDGEASIICACERLKANNIPFWCIIDEAKARKVAESKNLSLTGIIGLLLWEYERDELNSDDLQRIKRELRASPFRISDNILNHLDV